MVNALFIYLGLMVLGVNFRCLNKACAVTAPAPGAGIQTRNFIISFKNGQFPASLSIVGHRNVKFLSVVGFEPRISPLATALQLLCLSLSAVLNGGQSKSGMVVVHIKHSSQ